MTGPEKNWHENQEKDEGGKRFDQGKARFDLMPALALHEIALVYDFENNKIPCYDKIPADVLTEIADIFTFGCIKYSAHNWRQGMSWSRCFGPLERHLNKFWLRYDGDVDSKKHHLAHAAWNCIALIEYEYCKLGEDDRIKYPPEIYEMADVCDMYKKPSMGYTWSEYYRRASYYAWRFWYGESINNKSKIHNLAYCAYYCFELMKFDINKIGKDDGPKSNLVSVSSSDVSQYMQSVLDSRRNK